MTSSHSTLLWIRLGDAAEYESFQDLEAVAELFGEAGIKSGEMEQRQSGVVTPDYSSCNYISLFWGEDDQPEKIRDLTTTEFLLLKALLDGLE